MLLGTVTVI